MDTQTGIAQGLAGRYATALFELAVDGKSLDAVGASLATVKRALGESADLRSLTTSPMIDRKTAAASVGALASAMQLDPLTANFLGVLAKNRRLAQLPQVIAQFEALAAARRGETVAVVTSAVPLSGAQQEALNAKLKTGLRRDVALDLRVDPAILGGLIVRTGSRMIDSSIRTRLDALGQAMQGK